MSARAIVWVAMAAIVILAALLPVRAANANERSLYLHYTHTGETTRIVFKRNGQFVQSGLNELNRFLRDWRTGGSTEMDPRLFDLIWQVYQDVDARQPVNIVSAYRSPKTNAMLRRTSSGVAENSQHTQGTAMDFFIPGVPLSRLRASAMKLQVGGVGYYPKSGSPFVHLDTGNVRAWPRMTKAQLQEIFPNGRTLHLPPSGTPLSRDGYRYAQAEWKKCHSVPCGGSAGGDTRVADSGSSGRTLVDMLFGGSGENGEASSPARMAVAETAPPASSSETREVASAPVPMLRPEGLGQASDLPFSTEGSAPLENTTIPMPATKSAILVAATTPDANDAGETAAMAVASLGDAPMPAPRVLMTTARQEADILSAYAPAEATADGEIGSLIASAAESIRTPASLPALPGDAQLRTASIGPSPQPEAVNRLFEGTWGAVVENGANPAMQQALADFASRAGADVAIADAAFVAPELEQVDTTLVSPDRMTSDHFAVIFPHDGSVLDPAAALGPEAPFLGNPGHTLNAEHFTAHPPIIVASR